MLTLRINGSTHEVDVPEDMPLLYVLRDVLGLTGTKFGCGAGQCWGCAVLVDGKARPSCNLPVTKAAESEIVTIEGVAESHPVKEAWLEEQVPQCGWCQPGQIMQAVSLLETTPSPDRAAIRKGMEKNLCRCGTYPRIEKAVASAATRLAAQNQTASEETPAAQTTAAEAGEQS